MTHQFYKNNKNKRKTIKKNSASAVIAVQRACHCPSAYANALAYPFINPPSKVLELRFLRILTTQIAIYLQIRDKNDQEYIIFPESTMWIGFNVHNCKRHADIVLSIMSFPNWDFQIVMKMYIKNKLSRDKEDY